MSNDHKHHFQAKYKRVPGGVVIDNPCKCMECDQLARVEMKGYRVTVTLIPQHPQIEYTIDVVESEKP